MYTKLTKVVKLDDGRECVACAFFGTEKCHIHKKNDNAGCGCCEVFAAILNQLHTFEDIYDEECDK